MKQCFHYRAIMLTFSFSYAMLLGFPLLGADALSIDSAGAVTVSGTTVFQQAITLTPAATAGPPAVGTWARGALATDSNLDVWQCLTPSPSATWRKIFPVTGGGTANVIQVVNSSATLSTSSLTWVDTGIAVTISPLSGTASKVLIGASGVLGATSGMSHQLTIYRDVNGALTNIAPATPGCIYNVRSNSADGDNGNVMPFSFQILDAPAATAAQTVTYRLYWKTNAGTQYFGRRALDTLLASPTILTAQEIK